MYSAPYGYPNAAGRPVFNGAPPQGLQLQAGQSPNQPQQMMYNPQQFPMTTQTGPFPGGPNPAMMGGVGPAGMMQNAAMPHMTANGQMAYQAPFTTSPYGAGIPSSVAPQPQLPANFMMAGQMAPYQMNAGLAPQQPMLQQRMHPTQQNTAGVSVSTPQRPFNPSQGTPNGTMPHQQPQFSTPQQQGTPQSQTPTTAPLLPTSIATPQTPTFPAEQGQLVNGTSNSPTPQSPATESRDKERFAVLLDINQELLYESIQLVNSRAELKREQAAAEAGGTKIGDVDYAEEEKLTNQDYNHCMRRLQANLTYMFSLADKKPKTQVPPCPAFMTPPPLNLNLKLRLPPGTPDDGIDRPADPVADRAERDHLIKNLYKKLLALYPGIDPRKEPAAQMAGRPAGNANAAAAKANGQVTAATTTAGGLGSNHSSPAPGPPSQNTPQMVHAAAPGLQGQAAGS